MDEAELTIKPIKAAPDEMEGIKSQVKGQLRVPMPTQAWAWHAGEGFPITLADASG
jgi:hypothetical protein